jgi:hypothetical protein
MPRYKLTIEYDGAPFCGWQIQDNGASVQGALETAVKAICGEQVRVHGAGRTDAGVHALAQVAHCDITKHFVPGRLRDGLNARRGFPRNGGTICIASAIGAPTSRSISVTSGGCRGRSIPMRCMMPRSA